MTRRADAAMAGRGCQAAAVRTPTGLQSTAALARRRFGFHAAHLLLSAGLLALALAALAPGGLSALEGLLLICLALAGGYAAFDAANALLSALLLATARDPVARAAPYAPQARGDVAPIAARTAIAVCARNEGPGPILERLARLREALETRGVGAAFGIFYLSDSDDPAVIDAEEAAFAAAQRRLCGGGTAAYRRRARNAGFKAGNLQDFAEAEGREYELALVLDADGWMGPDALIAHIRAMQRHPRIAVLQSLILPFPGASFFDRVFRIGVRASVKTHYLGRAFWQADLGAYGGHNALIRLAALREDGALRPIPGPPPLGGAVLGHDHVEAMVMAARGWEIRLWPEECDSLEHHPPSLLDYAARDARWSRGAMQYAWLAAAGGWPGGPRLRPAARFHLAQFAWQHLAAPAFIAALGLSAAIAWTHPGGVAPGAAGALAAILAGLAAAPRLVGYIDQATLPGRVRALGGPGRFIRDMALDLALTALFAPVVFFETTRSLIALGADRFAGRPLSWSGQRRGAEAIGLGEAARRLWPATAFGLVCAAGFASAGALAAAAPALAGLVLAIPLAALTSAPGAGRILGPQRLAAPGEATRRSPG